jgi:hypothetical protein
MTITGEEGVSMQLGSGAQGRYVSLLDIQEAADHVSWRAKVEWKLADGAIVDDEQMITVHAPQSDFYQIDVERSLSPRGEKAVTIKAGDGGGLVVHFKKEPRDLTVFDGVADWNGEFEGQVWGMAILEHPSSRAFPSQWMSDDKTFAATPFLKKEGKIEPGKPAVFRYRLVIHKGDWSRERIQREQAQFAVERAVQ